VTDLDPADRRPSQAPLPPDLAALQHDLDRMADEAIAEIRAAEHAAAEAYAALPWWRRRLVDFRDWRWRIKFHRRTGRYPKENP
jgi:hypothetical protein